MYISTGLCFCVHFDLIPDASGQQVPMNVNATGNLFRVEYSPQVVGECFPSFFGVGTSLSWDENRLRTE